MLLEKVLNVLFGWVFNFLSYIPFSQYEIPTGNIEAFMSYVDMASYFVPIDTILVLLMCIVVEEFVKIWIALIRFLWKFVPFIGA